MSMFDIPEPPDGWLDKYKAAVGQTTPEQRTRAMGFHIPDNWRDIVRLADVGSGYTTPPVASFENGPLICDGWDFGVDA